MIAHQEKLDPNISGTVKHSFKQSQRMVVIGSGPVRHSLC